MKGPSTGQLQSELMRGFIDIVELRDWDDTLEAADLLMVNSYEAVERKAQAYRARVRKLLERYVPKLMQYNHFYDIQAFDDLGSGPQKVTIPDIREPRRLEMSLDITKSSCVDATKSCNETTHQMIYSICKCNGSGGGTSHEHKHHHSSPYSFGVPHWTISCSHSHLGKYQAIVPAHSSIGERLAKQNKDSFSPGQRLPPGLFYFAELSDDNTQLGPLQVCKPFHICKGGFKNFHAVLIPRYAPERGVFRTCSISI
eukprot:Nk52_evm10s267 gene=Nk52_evmTU10s267